MEKYNDLEVVKLVDPTYMKKLEVCLEYGKPALVEDVAEDLDPPLDPILLKQTFKQGNLVCDFHIQFIAVILIYHYLTDFIPFI